MALRIGDHYEEPTAPLTISMESVEEGSIYALEAHEPDLDLRQFNKHAIAVALESYSVPSNSWSLESERSWLATQASQAGATMVDKTAAAAAAIGAAAGAAATKVAGWVWDKTKEYTMKAIVKTSDAAKSAVNAGLDKAKEYSDKNNRAYAANETRINDLRDRIEDKDDIPKDKTPIEVSDRTLLCNSFVPRNAQDFIKKLELMIEVGHYLERDYSKQIDNIAETYIQIVQNQDYATSFAASATVEKIVSELSKTGFIDPSFSTKELPKQKGQYFVNESEPFLGNRRFYFTRFDFEVTEGMTAWQALNLYYDQEVSIKDNQETVRMARWSVDMPNHHDMEKLLDKMEELNKLSDSLNKQVLKNTVPQYEEKIKKTYTGRTSAIGNILQKTVDKAMVNTVGTESTKTVAKIMQTYPEWTVQVYTNYIKNNHHVLASLSAWLNTVLKHY